MPGALGVEETRQKRALSGAVLDRDGAAEDGCQLNACPVDVGHRLPHDTDAK
jgi:hypothetical protein